MNESDLDIFVQGAKNYFAQIADEELTLGTAYLVENRVPAARDYTGVISISGRYRGIVYFTAPRDLLGRMLVWLGEQNTSEEFLTD